MEEQKKLITEIIKHSSYDLILKPDDMERAVQYVGTPRKHASDSAKIVLFSDPFSDNDLIYEFSIKDILQVEELDTISAEDGRSALKVKIWVKKGSLAIQSKPFIV